MENKEEPQFNAMDFIQMIFAIGAAAYGIYILMS
jgi:hypothetical protein